MRDAALSAPGTGPRQTGIARGGPARGARASALQRRFGVVSEADDETNARIYASVSSLADFLESQQARGAPLAPK